MGWIFGVKFKIKGSAPIDLPPGWCGIGLSSIVVAWSLKTGKETGEYSAPSTRTHLESKVKVGFVFVYIFNSVFRSPEVHNNSRRSLLLQPSMYSIKENISGEVIKNPGLL